jgi:hypothetical protein
MVRNVSTGRHYAGLGGRPIAVWFRAQPKGLRYRQSGDGSRSPGWIAVAVWLSELFPIVVTVASSPVG